MAAHRLVLVRHGESAWNLENRFCGWYDADLSPAGQQEARRGGEALRGTGEPCVERVVGRVVGLRPPGPAGAISGRGGDRRCPLCNGAASCGL